jgi:hypothetical protein
MRTERKKKEKNPLTFDNIVKLYILSYHNIFFFVFFLYVFVCMFFFI